MKLVEARVVSSRVNRGPSDAFVSLMAIFVLGVAGTIAYQLGLHIYAYAVEPSNEAPFRSGLNMGAPSLVCGAITYVVAARVLGRHPGIEGPLLRATFAYLLLQVVVFVGMSLRVPGGTWSGGLVMLGLVLVMIPISIAWAPLSAVLFVADNGLGGILGAIGVGAASVGPLLLLIFVCAARGGEEQATSP